MKSTALARGTKPLQRHTRLENRTPIGRSPFRRVADAVAGWLRLKPEAHAERRARRLEKRERLRDAEYGAIGVFAPDAGVYDLQIAAVGLRQSGRLRFRSARQAIRQAAWNAITAAKIANGDPCERCGSEHRPDLGPLHTLCGHHRQPAGQGGKWVESNHCLMCGTCHRQVHDHPEQAVADGWIVVVKQQITPAADHAPGLRGRVS